ncbi:uncharacterized protein BO95DRAFT_518599 [Aspergillus brunneoviolaceus CBS 621.78]|uniref:Uncharacterized protein n=1 Tax=Aspergillus brunneoviolaceus CBS 621.78 TaxID=1450534 RepID=A0ACD1FU99_9EURO|nr:hypothetical protein BO95DRAFT_518599 [Aspergillus brunneoviolaceus CBS 621.78]RAH40552.1 hypothetical protein BO95DRAFT_518599 [Aspergillus brunneoviolaceus CBS 621.78]
MTLFSCRQFWASNRHIKAFPSKMSSLLKNPVQDAVQGPTTKAVQDTAATVIDISKAVEQLLDGLASQPQQILHVYLYSD